MATSGEKVAVYSPKNLYKYGIGELRKGYNIVPKEVADKWISLTPRVRLGTPEEVASYYGKI
jgi:hypothetical protein